ncbi:hypothetical protein ACLESO_07690 [Pyxidicoccus sp. 3LG]
MAQTEGPPAADAQGDCQFPLGYDGVLRIRAAPHLVLTPTEQHQPPPQSTDVWHVVVGGSCENLVGAVPCRLEWIVTSNSFAERRMAHRRETCLVPSGKSFTVREKTAEGTRALQVSLFELGLIGKGRLGFRLEPLLFGNAPVEVKPADARAIPFDLGGSIDFVIAPSELTSDWVPDIIERNVRRPRVGTVMKLEPDFASFFTGHLATVDIYPPHPEGMKPDESATVRIEWEIGSAKAADVLLWRVGFLAVRGDEKEVLENRLAAFGGMESSETLAFQYRLAITRKQEAAAPAPAGKKGEKKKAPPPPPVERVHADARLALEVPRPRLKTFEVVLDKGRLGVQGRFENFSDSVVLDLRMKPYVRLPDGEGWRVEELDDSFRNVLLNVRFQASFPLQHGIPETTAANLCLPDDVAAKLVGLETVTVGCQRNAFERELLNLKKLPAAYVEALTQVPGLEVFVAMTPQLGAGARVVPFWAIADYDASEPGLFSGFAPFEDGTFVSRVFSSGVCTSNTVDLAGHAARLYSPMPVVPPERQEEFSLFVGTVCGEAIGESEPAWTGVAHTIMNRVARRYESWKECFTSAEIITKTGFDGRKHRYCAEAREYLKAPAASSLSYREKLERLIATVTPIFMRQAGNCGDVVFFYSPQAQAKLHKEKPTEYPAVPGFVGQDGDKKLVDITSKVLGGVKSDFRFYAFKYPEKFPRWTKEEMLAARAKPPVAKGK